jgi:exonuclease-1
MLIFFGVTPYLVFDGDNLPSKAGTESARLTKRQESKKLALELYSKGRTADAYQEFQKAVDVTPYMARQLIEELKKMKVQYVVAPYEADAQLVYLERNGIINGIISEDSDLLVFGAKRLLSKLDQHGDCVEINRGDFTACRDISLIGWTDADFRRMCILSGCDYLPSIPKMGLKTAYRSIRKYKSVEKVLRILQFEGQHQVPANYLDDFKQAELTFLYQRVFCPKVEKLVTLTPLDDSVNVEEMSFIGDDVDPEIALGVACGDLDPMTKEPIILKPSMAARAVPGITRRQTLASSAELKSNKPISAFFTPKRMPLAELDPNSLTPSPSQQRLLERHANNSWEPSPAPARSSLTRSASSISQTRPAASPMVRTAERESFLARAAKTSTIPSAKRQRLCSDTDEETLPTSSKECRSRFFLNGSSQPSPSGQKLARTKKSRRSTFGVFSDDIAEDIMCQLADQQAPVESSQKATIADPEPRMSDGSAVSVPTLDGPSSTGNPVSKALDTEDNVSTDVDSGSISPPEDISQVTSTTSVSPDTDPELFDQVLDAHVKNQNASLLSKYAFSGPGAISSSGSIEASDGKAKQDSITSSAGSHSATRRLGFAHAAEPANRRRLTPLQRLGQTALTKSRSMDSLGIRKMLAATRDSGYESDFGEATPALKTHHGSEDLLVPCSDEEEGESVRDDSRQRSLNLQRFSFTPN